MDSPPAYVFKGHRLCGTILRTTDGSVFTYSSSYLAEPETTAPSIATTIPKSQVEHAVRGVNLLPYFANLLPEGWILQTVASRLKTSRDDLLSLLVAVGGDTIGDVWVSWDKNPKATQRESWSLADSTFDDILTEQYGDPLKPIEWVSIPGVQAKVSANRITLPGRLKNAPEAIIKINLDPKKLPHLIENEQFFMTLAKSCGLPTPRTRIIHDAAGAAGLWIERFDRSGDGNRIHQEDGCQILGIYPAEKYNTSARAIGYGIKQVCRTWAKEILHFIELYAFSILIGNGDLHAKNVSVLESPQGLLRLSPAYDLLSTLPYKDDRMALKLNGRDANFKGRYLLEFGESLGVPSAATRFRLEKLLRAFGSRYAGISKIGFDERQTASLITEIQRRANRLSDFT
jgi:serine/threonine-protein kinase HipA